MDKIKDTMDLIQEVFESSNVKILTTTTIDQFGDNDIEYWFCAKDVCNILEYSNYRQSISLYLDDDCKVSLNHLVVLKNKTTSKDNFNHLSYNDLKATYINEEGLYRLMFHCKLPVAKKFQKWIFKEVLPTIRKTGKFELQNALKTKEEELSLAMEKLAIKEKSEEELRAEQLELKKKLVKAERKAIRVNKFMKRVTIKEKKLEWIYIATNKYYALERLFKIGSTIRLSSRIRGYNTGRAKGVDNYYYVWAIRCYNSKDVDNHIQKLLADFKWNDPKRPLEQQSKENRSEMYHGIKFTDLKDIVTFIVNNYDASIDYINNFIKTRLDQSLEEEDEIPPPLDYKNVTYQIGDHIETIDIENEEYDSIRDTLDDVLTGIKEQCERNNQPVVVHRKDLVSRLSYVTNMNKKDLWGQIKELTGWTSSNEEIDDGDFKYKIIY